MAAQKQITNAFNSVILAVTFSAASFIATIVFYASGLHAKYTDYQY